MQRMRMSQKIPIEVFSFFIKPFFHEQRKDQPINWKEVKNILILDTIDLLGDMVMLLGFLKILRLNAPAARITVCARPFTYGVLKNLDLIDDFIGLSLKDSFAKKKEVLGILNKQLYDLAINPRGDFRDILYMYFVNAQRKISHTRTGGGFLLTDPLPADYSDPYSHAIEDRIYILDKLGCKYDDIDKYPILKLDSKGQDYVKEYFASYSLNGKIIVGVHPGASGRVKKWIYYYELLKKIQEEYENIFFVIFSGPGDKVCVDSATRYLQGEYIIVSEGIENYVKLIGFCDCFISNDSGAAHIAAAYGMPTIDIFTNNLICCWKPYNYNGKTICIGKDLPCKPCYRSDECKKKTLECNKSISVEEVFTEFTDMFNKIKGKNNDV